MGIDDIRKASKVLDEKVQAFVEVERAASELVAQADAARARAKTKVDEATAARASVDEARKELNGACDGFFRPVTPEVRPQGSGVGAEKADAGPDHGRCPVTSVRGEKCGLSAGHGGREHQWVPK